MGPRRRRVVPVSAALRAVALALALASCGRDRLELVPASQRARTPPSIRSACALAEARCSRCHDLERIQLAHPALVDWPVYVERMRRMPGSGITVDEASTIVSCLTWVERARGESEL